MALPLLVRLQPVPRCLPPTVDPSATGNWGTSSTWLQSGQHYVERRIALLRLIICAVWALRQTVLISQRRADPKALAAPYRHKSIPLSK
jgi:hypothetical protein